MSVSRDQLENARLDLLHQRGFDVIDQWGELLAAGWSNDEVVERLLHSIRRCSSGSVMKPRLRRGSWNAKTHWIRLFTACCDWRTDFWRKSYTCKSKPVSPTLLIWQNATPRDQNATPTASWVPFSHPGASTLVEKLKVAQPGYCWNPRIGLVASCSVGALRAGPFTDEVSEQMREEMFNTWIHEETATILSRWPPGHRPRSPSVTSATSVFPATQAPFLSLREHPAFRGISEASYPNWRAAAMCSVSIWVGSCVNLTKPRIPVILQGRARLVGRHNGRLTTVGKLGPRSVVGASLLSCAPCENVIAAEEVIACAISDQLWRELYLKKRSVIGVISSSGPRSF